MSVPKQREGNSKTKMAQEQFFVKIGTLEWQIQKKKQDMANYSETSLMMIHKTIKERQCSQSESYEWQHCQLQQKCSPLKITHCND